MKSRIALSLALALTLVFQITSLAFAKSPTIAANPLKNIAVTDSKGNLTNGVLNINSFAVKGGRVVANGTLTGTLKGQQITQQVAVPVTTGDHSCEILNLTLGPINLNLLGLVVQTNTINVRIAAEPGSGNLLGNLLCEVAKLLDGNGRALGRLVNLLNQILGALG